MEERRHYDLVALQLNVSPASANEQCSMSKTGTQFLIKEYIKRCDSEILPDPAFVALQDGVTTNDWKNVRSAFKERQGAMKGDLVEASKSEKGISLLYDRTVLTEIKDQEWKLVESDFEFRENRGKKAAHLMQRIAGGLFQHQGSTHFIVAISYHGRVKNKIEEAGPQKKECVIELLNALKRKYSSKKPLYLVLGDFNLALNQCQLPSEWGIYPKQRETARKLRHRVPIDFVLVSGLFDVEHTTSLEFSPLPLEIKRENGNITSYRFPQAAGLLTEDRKAITPEDLEHFPVKNNSTLLDEFENKQKFLISDTKRTFDHDFIFFRTRIQHTENEVVIKGERDGSRESTPSKPRAPRRTSAEACLNRSAIKVLGQLCQNSEWRNFNGTDEEWLNLTNQLIKNCKLDPGPMNVRELLLHMGPKQETQRSQSKPIHSFFSRISEAQ